MANTLALWRGAVEPASVAPSGNAPMAWRGAVEPAVSDALTDAQSSVQIGVGRRGGHAVESHIGGFAGFNIQRPKDRPAPAKKPMK